MVEGFFVAEGGGLVFDLVADAVGGEVGSFGEGEAVLFPSLSEVLGADSFEGLALVVLHGGVHLIEVFLGADDEALGVDFEELFLCGGGLEAEAHSLSTTGSVELEDVGHYVGFCDAGVDVAVFSEAENVIVGIGDLIIAVNHGFE